MLKRILVPSSLMMLLFSINNATAQSSVTLPFTETFNPTSVTLNQWNITNPDPIVIMNPTVSAYGIDSGSLMYNFFNSSGHMNYNVQTPIIENINRSGLKLSFDFAAAAKYNLPIALPQDFANDYIYVQYSTDSGQTFSLVDTFRIGTDGILNTAGIISAIFTPNATQWTTIDNIKIPKGTNRIAFTGTRYNSINGNMAYLDNVVIDTCFTPIPTGDTLQYDSAYVTLADLVVNGTSLKWYTDSTTMNGLSDTTSLTDSTYYYVTQTIDGCEGQPLRIFFADTTTVTLPPDDSSTNVQNIQFKNTTISPNPFNNQINIKTDLVFSSISLYDITGKLIKEYPANAQTINTEQLPIGIYILRLATEEGNKNIKIVKE